MLYVFFFSFHTQILSEKMCLLLLGMTKANKDEIAFLKSTLKYEVYEPFVANNDILQTLSHEAGMENIHRSQPMDQKISDLYLSKKIK